MLDRYHDAYHGRKPDHANCPYCQYELMENSMNPESVADWPVLRSVSIRPGRLERQHLALVIVDRGREYSDLGRFAVLEASSSDGTSWVGYWGTYDLSRERAAEVFAQRKAELGSRVVPDT